MYVIAFTTCPDEKSAGKISDIILKKWLAACLNTIPGMNCRYGCNGKITSGSECFLMIKARESALKGLEKVIRDNHPYELPELIAVPVTGGSGEYLDWIKNETSHKG
jgi:periplasmic divalent cation tolerance protein